MRRRLGFVLAFLFLGASPLRAGEGFVVLTEAVQLRVAEAFLAEKEYYRAITEFKRFLYLFPESERGDQVLLQTGSAYLQGGDPDQAARSFLNLREKFPSSPLVPQSRFLEGLAVWKGKDREKAKGLFKTLADEDPPSPDAPRSLGAAALIRLEEDDPQGSRDTLQRFLETYPDHPWVERVREAEALLIEYQSLPEKSEVLAGILSAILPGAGYAYTGELATGFMSLAVNGAFIAATWTAFAQGLEAVGILAGGVGLPFYIGNIYGSALAARKWNQTVKNQARAKIYSALDFVFE
jgi:outer membrane protein assembly factor BamD (BamD/ComL family)